MAPDSIIPGLGSRGTPQAVRYILRADARN